MATPRWWSKDEPAYAVIGTTVTAATGNWKQFPSGEQLNRPRYIYRWWVNGQPVRIGYDLSPIPSSSPPSASFVGEGDYSIDVARFGPGTHHVVFQVWAGNYFTGWGDHPDDAIEWGGDQNTDRSPYVVALAVTVAAPPPPPPATKLTRAEAKRQMLALADKASDDNGYSPFARIEIAALILESKDDVWLDAQQAVPKAIRDLLKPEGE